MAQRFPAFEKVHRALTYVLTFLAKDGLHAAISRCVYDTYCALGQHGGSPDNFPAICSCIFDRCKQGRGRSLVERRGCIHTLQQLVAEIVRHNDCEGQVSQFGVKLTS